MIITYKLLGKLAVPCSIEEWAKWWATADRRVARTDIDSHYVVSTVFIGYDPRLDGDPLLFETMIFEDGKGIHRIQSATWGEAEKAHAKAIAVVHEKSDL